MKERFDYSRNAANVKLKKIARKESIEMLVAASILLVFGLLYLAA